MRVRVRCQLRCCRALFLGLLLAALACGARAQQRGWSDGKSPPPHPEDFAAIVSRPIGFPMTIAQRADLLAFLKTLTDWHLVCDPRLSDPFVPRVE